MMKKWISGFLLVLMASFLMVGCSNNTTSDGKIELKVLEKWPEPANAPYFESVAKEFEKAHPNIKVTLEAVADEPMHDKLRTALGGGDAPDIAFSWSGEFTTKFIRAGAALDITKYLDENKDWKNSFSPSSLGAYMYDGKNYGIPLRMNGKVFAYNKTIFDKYGLKEPTTWDEFLAVCETLKSHGVTPIILGNQLRWPIIHYLTGFNEKLVAQDTLNKDYDRNSGAFTDQGYVDALNKVKELSDKGYFNKNVNSVSQDMGKEMFYAGKGAILNIETEEIPHLEKNMKDQWGIFKMPEMVNGKGNQNFLVGAPEGFIVTTATKHPKEAIEFLKFLTNKTNAERMVKELGWLSPIKGAVNQNTATPAVNEANKMMEDSEGLAIWLDTIVDAKIAEAYLQGAQLLLNGDKSPEQIMKEIQQIAKDIK